MGTKKRAVPPAEPSEQELEAAARELVQHGTGLAGSEFKKGLAAKYKKFDKLVLRAAEQLAAKGELHRWSSAKKVRFFTHDPLEMLPVAVREVLNDAPLTEFELAKRVEAAHRGFGDLSKEWLKRALAHGDIHQHPPTPGSKIKRYWTEPDIAGLLKKVIAEIGKVLESPAGRHVAKERVLEVIAQNIGVATQVAGGSSEIALQSFLRALTELTREQPPGALLSVRELRLRVGLDKNTFDSIALELLRKGTITLHHHDFPGSLPDSKRSQLIVDKRGIHYVGIALRSGS